MNHPNPTLSLLRIFGLFIMLSFFYFNGKAIAQKVSREEKKAARAAKRQEKIDQGKIMVSPLVGPAYTPELGFTLNGGVMLSFKTNPSDTLIQRSSSPLMLGFSSTGAFFVGTKFSSFWKQDKLRIYADINFKDMPDNYYGVGYEAGLNTPQGDSTTKYTRTWFQFFPKFLYQFKQYNFIGPAIDINYTKGRDASPGVLEDETYQEFNEKPFNAGLGARQIYQWRCAVWRDVAIRHSV